MTKTIQHLRGTTAQNDAFTGAAGEITVDTTTNELRLHDGSTAGGHVIPNKAFLGGGTAGTLLTNSGTPGTVNSTSIDATPTDSSTNPVSSGGVYTDLAGKANKDLDNLTDTGKNIANWSNNITNCIIESPQDIKVEVANGAITLKAGSKLYVPAGFEQDGTTPKFNVITITEDLSYSNAVGTATRNSFWSVVADDTSFTTNVRLEERELSNIQSGTTTPSSQVQYYNTNENIIHFSGTQNTRVSSFPICFLLLNSGVITSLGTVYNGLGFIGSTVYVLPGLKVACPDGRNADGSLKNRIVEFVSVITKTYNYSITPGYFVINGDNDIGISVRSQNLFQNNPPAIGNSYERWYSPDKNEMYYHAGGGTSWIKTNAMAIIGTANTNNGKIDYWVPKQAFQAVDYSDKEFIAEQAMPSNTYKDLTLPASGSTITMPADGYLYLCKVTTASGQYVRIQTGGTSLSQENRAISANDWCRAILPVSKGQNIAIYYNAAGDTKQFRLIYANGAK